MKKAVLLLTFNRIEYLEKVFEQVKIAKPPRLYIASDGPRANKDGEKELVESVRKYMLNNIDWDCKVKTRFLDINSGGCGPGVSSAITWFFDNEEDGIILEDDCVPNQSFFSFCEDLLDYYKDDKRVWHISGFNPLGIINISKSYYFAKVQHCWGWASWADRWKYFNIDLTNYDKKYVKKFSKDKNVKEYWLNILNALKRKETDSWAYPWTFCIIKHSGCCINPSKNLVSNIGITGIHYENAISDTNLNKKTYSIINVVHTNKIAFNKYLINKIYRKVFNIVFEKKELLNNINLLMKKNTELENVVNNISNSLDAVNNKLEETKYKLEETKYKLEETKYKLEETKYNVNWIKLFGIYNKKERLKIVIFGISIVLKTGLESINSIAWWIPIKKWRERFRKKFE